MTTTTVRSHPNTFQTHRKRRLGFTLAELTVTLFLFAIISVGTIQSFLFFTRSSLSSKNYADMESQARKGLELFARDARAANNIAWTNDKDLTLTVPTAAPNGTAYTYTVRYRYLDSTYTRSDLQKSFSRQVLGSTAPSITPVETAPTALMSGVSTFAFSRYKLGAKSLAAANDLETKQLEVALTAERQSSAIAKATNIVVSARFVLRNKIVSN